MRRRLVLLGAVAALAVACGAEDEAAPPVVPTVSPTPIEEHVEVARADLAAHLGVPVEAIEVAASVRVTWRDGSVGCPEPGRVYTQALVEGYRIELAVDGERFHYHGRLGEPPFRCDDPDQGATVQE